jgi:hypothetical protein
VCRLDAGFWCSDKNIGIAFAPNLSKEAWICRIISVRRNSSDDPRFPNDQEGSTHHLRSSSCDMPWHDSGDCAMALVGMHVYYCDYVGLINLHVQLHVKETVHATDLLHATDNPSLCDHGAGPHHVPVATSKTV